LKKLKVCSITKSNCCVRISLFWKWKSCIWSVAVCGSETWTVGKNEERVINAFETWCWRRMLRIKWTDRIKNIEVFQRAKEEILLLKTSKNRRHSWIGQIIRHNEFVLNILRRSNIGKQGRGKNSTTVLKAIRQKQKS
jgi:hypothetical protein